MKATTTVTTSSYYGATTTNTGNIRSTQSTLNAFIPPQQMLRRLLPYANTQKQKENIKPPRQQIPPSSQQPPINRNAVILDIENLQSELNNIHAEIIESENLLNVRDSLYGQLDLLREEREQIESDVGYLENQYSSSNEVRVNVKANHGYKEMNERLRRRTAEIREYIHKMELQNRKIEQNINYTNMLNIQKNYRTQINTNNAWIDNAYLDQRQRGTGRIDDLISRLHLKQEEALQRVRKQEDEINRRNQLNRASFSSSNLMMGSQGGARSYYGATGENSSVGRRRFYSPEYRY